MENELFSTRILADNRTYFLDLKKSKDNTLYLTITELKNKEGEGTERHRVIIFEEHLQYFFQNLEEILIKANIIPSGKQTYLVEEIRKNHPQAYMPWSKADDERLEKLYHEGMLEQELARIFQRNIGAIRSRIKKLEFKHKH